MIAVPDETDGWVGFGCSPRALDSKIVAIEVVIFRGEGVSTSSKFQLALSRHINVRRPSGFRTPPHQFCHPRTISTL